MGPTGFPTGGPTGFPTGGPTGFPTVEANATETTVRQGPPTPVGCVMC
ncbi:hypothetical protein ACF05Q_04995 [Streptomyces lydicus]